MSVNNRESRKSGINPRRKDGFSVWLHGAQPVSQGSSRYILGEPAVNGNLALCGGYGYHTVGWG